MEDIGAHHPKAWEPLSEGRHEEIWRILRSRVNQDVAICLDCAGHFQIEGMSMQHMVSNGEGIFRPVLVLCCNQCGNLMQYNAILLGIV